MNCFVPDVFEEVAGLVNHAKLSAVEGERSGVGVASLDDLEHHWIGLSFDCELTASGAVLIFPKVRLPVEFSTSRSRRSLDS